MMMITIQVLEALLSANGSHRQAAEQVLQNLSVEERLTCFTNILSSSANNTAAATTAASTNAVVISQLVAVLLRRDVLKCTQADLLQQLVAPLLQAFLEQQQSSSSQSSAATTTAITTAIGNCLATICSMLHLLQEPDAAVHVMRQILGHAAIAERAGNGHDVASLLLWVACAEYAPETFARAALGSLSCTSGNHNNLLTQVVTHYCSTSQSSSSSSSPETVAVIMTRLVVAAAISLQTTTSGSNSNSSDATAAAATATVTAAITHLGVTALAPLLQLYATCNTASAPSALAAAPSSSSGGEEDVLCHLLQAAQVVPALICGDARVAMAILQRCMNIITCTMNTNNRLGLLAMDTCRHVLSLPNQRQFPGMVGLLQQQPQQRSAMDHAVVQRLLNILLQSVAAHDHHGHGESDDTDDDDFQDDDWLGHHVGSSNGDIIDNDNNNEQLQAEADYARDLLEAWIRNAPATAVPLVLQAVEALLVGSGSGGGGSSGGHEENSWRNAWAAMVALEACLAGAPVMFRPFMARAIQTALTNLMSPSTRVQYQAIRFLGLVCEASSSINRTAHDDNDIVVYQQFGTQILQALATSVQSSKSSQVCRVACLALISFCRGGGNDNVGVARFVVPHLQDLLQAILAAPTGPLSSTSSMPLSVKIRAVGVVACLAQVSGTAFAKFYPHVMPVLLGLAQQPGASSSSSSSSRHVNHNHVAQLQGAALEAATIVGQALSLSSNDEDNDDDDNVDDMNNQHVAQAKQLFVQDAHTMMQWMLPVLTDASNSNSNSLPMDLLLSACARIASVLQEDYAPYAQTVLPLLLQRATAQTDVEITEGDEAGYDATRQRNYLHQFDNMDDNENDDGTESMTVAVPGRGLTKVSINTTQIQEKTQAIRAIYEHAQSLATAFGPYCQGFLDEFLLLVPFRYSPEVRATSSQTSAAILEAACLAGQEAGNMTTAQTYFPLVARAIAKEIHNETNCTEMEVLYALADSLSGVMYSAYSRRLDFGGAVVSGFTTADAKAVVEACMTSMRACLERRSIITSNLSQTAAQGEALPLSDDEKEEYMAQLLSEQALLTPLVDSVGWTLKTLGPAFLPIFEQYVAPILGPHLTNNNSSNVDIRARLSAVCLWDDVVEHCGSDAAAKFSPQLVQGVLLGMVDNDEDELQRASIYGIAQMARYAPSSVLLPHASLILQHLMAILTGSKETDNAAILENSVSALASLVLIGPNPPFQNNHLVSTEAALNLFLKNLPLSIDYDEAKICHEGLCDLIQQQDPLSISSPSPCLSPELSPWVLHHGPELVRILGETLALVSVHEEDVATNTTCQRMAGILIRLQQQASPGMLLQSSFAALQPEAQAAVQQAMEQYAYQFNNNHVVTP